MGYYIYNPRAADDSGEYWNDFFWNIFNQMYQKAKFLVDSNKFVPENRVGE